MNQNIYRLVWSRHAGCLVAVAETASGHGRPGVAVTRLTAAIAGAMLTLAAEQAGAVGACGVVSSNTTQSSSVAGPCEITTGANLTVTGTVNGSTGHAVIVNTGSAAGTLSNSGTLTSAMNSGSTVQINGTLSGGLLNQGVISETGGGNHQAVQFNHGVLLGGINNGSTGTISSGQTAIRILSTSFTGDISNSGLITGTYFGITFNTSDIQGNLINTGTLHGASSLLSSTIIGSVVNSGTMVSEYSTLSLGGGGITGGLTNTGTIISNNASSSSHPAALLVGGSSTLSGGVTNSGVISGTAGSLGLSVSDGALVGGVKNLTGGTISGASGLYVGGAATDYAYSSSSPATPVAGIGTLTGGITNSGHIIGTAGSGIVLDGGLVEGGVHNLAGATISGSQHGIELRSRTLTLYAYGSSTGSSSTITLTSNPVHSTLTGGITNSGLIQGGASYSGIYGDAATITEGIDNSGTIIGGTGLMLKNGSTLSGGLMNRASGTIIGTNGPAVYLLSGVSVSGGLTNQGLIDGGVELDDTLIDTITNDTTGVIVGGDGLDLGDTRVSGNVSNLGRILSSGDGVSLSNVTIGGNFLNAAGATITGLNGHGLDLDSATITGGLTNAGTISGTDNGIFFDGDAAFNLVNTGRIEGGSTAGIEFSYGEWAGSLTNSGTISGPTAGLYIWEYYTLSGDITNSGLIEGTGGSYGDGIFLESSATVTGRILNQAGGRIAGVRSGIDVTDGSTIAGGISNSGTISGTAGAGIAIDDALVGGVSLSGAALVNDATGVISGNTGISISSDGTVTGGIVNSGRIAGTTASVRLLNSSDPFTVTNTGTLDGAADIGINTLNLDGANSRVIGAITGTGGTVNVNGTFTSEGAIDVGTVNVVGGGVLNLGHDVGASVGGFNNAGTVAVGALATPLNVSGNYTQAAGGVYRLGLNDATTNYGKLAVSGNVNLASGTTVDVRVAGSATITSGAVVQGVITAGGTLTATPSAITVTDNSAFYSFTASNARNANQLDLITAVDPSGVVNSVAANNNPAGLGAAGTLQAMFNEGVPPAMQPVFDRLTLLTPEQLSDAVSQMLPTLVGAASQAGINALHSMNKIIQARIESNQGLSSGDGGRDQYLWLRTFGSWADQDDHKGVSGFKSRTGGVVVGVDAPVNNQVRAGGAFTYARSNVTGNSTVAPNHVGVDTYELVGYASYNLDPRTDINVQFDIGKNQADSTRRIGLTGATAEASFDSLAVHGSVGIGRVYPLSDHSNVTPSVRLDYTHVRTDGYTESGAGPLNLQVDAQTYREFLITGDLKGSHQLENGLKLVGNVSVSYDTLNKQAQTTSTFVGGGAAFVTNGLDVSPWLYRAGVGLIQDTSSGIEYSARYDIEGRSSGYLNQTLSVRLRWAF